MAVLSTVYTGNDKQKTYLFVSRAQKDPISLHLMLIGPGSMKHANIVTFAAASGPGVSTAIGRRMEDTTACGIQSLTSL